MKRTPKIGETGLLSFVVTEQHVIDFADEQMPAVLCTPWLIWFLEHAAREAMLPLLDADESTVGVHIDVEHLAPTPLGQHVTCTARVINTDGRLITFQFDARDQHERVARGVHKLQVIRCHRFASRVSAKTHRVSLRSNEDQESTECTTRRSRNHGKGKNHELASETCARCENSRCW